MVTAKDLDEIFEFIDTHPMPGSIDDWPAEIADNFGIEPYEAGYVYEQYLEQV